MVLARTVTADTVDRGWNITRDIDATSLVVARSAVVRRCIGVMTLLFGLAGALTVPSGQFSGIVAILVLVGSATTIPVALLWFVRPWPSDRLCILYVLSSDIGIVAVLLAFRSHYEAMPGCTMLSFVALFTIVGTSQRVTLIHFCGTAATMLTLGALSAAEGVDPWLVGSRAITISSIFATPFILKSFILLLQRQTTVALRDPLTGLWNRRGMLEAAGALAAATDADTSRQVITVTVIDVDRFKDINDKFGHPSGDAVLVEVAERLTQSASPVSVVSRLGGDEFVVVEIGPPAEVEESEKRIGPALEQNFRGPPFTASLGSATQAMGSVAGTHAQVRTLIALADIEMYRAKARTAGGPRTILPDRVSAQGDLVQIRERINALIACGGPEIVFQPICDIASNATVGYEALSRFPFGHGSPMAWFRDAASAGIGASLECAAIDHALAAMDGLPPDVFVSLNISAETIRATNLFDRLSPYLQKRVMHLEITEHERIDDYRAIAHSLEDLREAGVLISVDDVGAGFAGLRQVVELRPDVLKIDYLLVNKVDTDPARRAATAAIISLARAIGSLVIVEGVETEAELRVAAELGAGMVQGFLAGRPLPVAEYSSRRARSE